MTIKSH